MTKLLQLKIALLAVALVGVGLAAPEAYAGSRDKTVCRSSGDYQRSYHQRSSYNHRNTINYNTHRHYGNHTIGNTGAHVSYRNDGIKVSVGYSSHNRHGYHTPHYDRRHYSHNNVRYYNNRNDCNTYSRRTVVVNNHGGYWNRVYIQPVYQIRYRSCGTPFRVCVRAGYWKNVWVSGSYCR